MMPGQWSSSFASPEHGMDSLNLDASYYAETEYLCDQWAIWARQDVTRLDIGTNILWWLSRRKLDLSASTASCFLSEEVCLALDLMIARLPEQQKRAIVLKHMTYAPVKAKAKAMRVGVRRFYDLVSAGYRRVYCEINVDS